MQLLDILLTIVAGKPSYGFARLYDDIIFVHQQSTTWILRNNVVIYVSYVCKRVTTCY